MEVSLLTPASIRIKSKQATFLVDPTDGKLKLSGDAVFLTLGNSLESPDVEGVRLTISGPGEYEIGGVKITGVKSGEGTAFFLSVEGMSLLVGQGSSLKGKESLRDVDVALILADGTIDQSALATVANGAAVLYGLQAAETVKALGKEVLPTAKYVITKDKLPAEMEVVLLG